MVRRALACIAIGCGALGCVSTSPYGASNSVKMGQAAGFAGAAAVATVVQSAMEARARNNAPTSHGGLSLSPQCDNDGQYPCASVTHSPSDPALRPPAEPEMTDEETRTYVMGFLNGVRKLNDVGLVMRDPNLDGRAQAICDERARDGSASSHRIEAAGELGAVPGELEGTGEGSSERLLQERVGAILLGWMQEKAEGEHRGMLTRRPWRKIGVGIATRSGHTYLTIDFSP